MALRQKIEWDPEEVAAGYDLSTIYEGVDDNFTAPVISSVVNTTAGFSSLVEEAVKKVVAVAINATPTTTITPASSAVVPLSSSTPSTVSTIVKRVVEQLAKEPSSPVATVCIYYFCETLNRVYFGTVVYTHHHTVYKTVQFVS